jgi:hypothetical protein
MKTPCPPRPREHSVPTRAPVGRRLLLASVAGLLGLFVNVEAAPPELKTSGNKIVVKATGVPVRLTGVNIPSLEWGQGEYIMTSLEVAVRSWKANVIRLPVSNVSWFGSNALAYRATVDAFIARASDLDAYVILDLHDYVKTTAAHATFWDDAADRYKNNPAVLFGLLNEPHTVSEQVWRNGDSEGPGMQGLLERVRATGANNIVLAGGLDWGYKLLNLLPAYALVDTASGNGVVYDSHVYPWKTYIHKDVGNPAQQYPVLLGEFGHPGGTTFNDLTFEPEDIWVPRLLDWADTQNLHWTGWCFYPGADPRMLADWNHTPSAHWGAPAKARLRAYANPNALRVVGGTVIGTPGHRSTPGSGVLTHYTRGAVAAFDDYYSTFYEAAAASGCWTGLDLATPKRITQIRYMPKLNYGGLMLGGVFQGSNSATFDGGVAILHTVTVEPNDDGGVYTTATVSDPGSYRYVRYLGPDGKYCTVASILFYTGSLVDVPADDDVIVLDDTSPSVTVTGTWGYSTVDGRYGDSSRYDTSAQKGTSSVRYTPTLTSPGLYEVFVRWNAYGNRSLSVPIDINHLQGTSTVYVNQRANGGQWNSVGTHAFDVGTDGNVLIRTGGTTSLVIADAVMFAKVADVEEEVEIIMDNTAASGVTLTGAWTPATTVPGYWDSNYVHDGDAGKGTKTARFTPTITDAGDYEVFVLWTGRSINASSVPVTVTHAGGSDTIPVNQTTGNGEWFSLGVHPFAAGTAGNVLISNTGTTGRVVVDAVRFHKSGPPRTTIITSDTEDAGGVTVAGAWSASNAVPGYNGSNYLQDGGTDKGSKTVTFAPNLPQAGVYDVYMNWTPSSNRAPSVTVRIDHAAGTDYKTINQQSYGGSRLRLGSYSFTAGTAGKVIIGNANTTGFVIVDSVRFELN